MLNDLSRCLPVIRQVSARLCCHCQRLLYIIECYQFSWFLSPTLLFCFVCHDIIVYHSWLFSDVNECRQKPDICGPNSVCRNTKGGYQCPCSPGYIRKTDSCIGKNCFLFTLSEVRIKATAFTRIPPLTKKQWFTRSCYFFITLSKKVSSIVISPKQC